MEHGQVTFSIALSLLLSYETSDFNDSYHGPQIVLRRGDFAGRLVGRTMDDNAGGGQREDFGCGDGAGPESLELHERRAPVADGRRSPRDRVHAISGRRPGQLHGGGHVVRRFPVDFRRRHCRAVDRARPAVRADGRIGRFEPTVLRRGVRRRPVERDNRPRARRRFRRRHRRTVGRRLRVPLGRLAALATDLRDSVADHFVRGTSVHRTRVQPRVRGAYDSSLRRSRHVRPTVRQRRATVLRHNDDQLPGYDLEKNGPTAVRRCSNGLSLRDLSKQSLRDRNGQARSV